MKSDLEQKKQPFFWNGVNRKFVHGLDCVQSTGHTPNVHKYKYF